MNIHPKKTVFHLLAGLVALGFIIQCGEGDRFYSNTLRADLFQQLYTEDKYDFLWVFDNSYSMTDKVAYVRDNFDRFLKILNSRKAIDYQMAVIHGDRFENQKNDFKLLSNKSGLEVVKSSSPDSPADFASILNNIQDTFTSFWEQHLESTYQTVSKHGGNFMRQGVPLVIILVSDADDYSCQSNCYGREPNHNPDFGLFPIERYIDYFKNVKSSEDTTTSFFPIIALHSSACDTEDFGMRYQQVAKSLNGFSGSMCLADIGASLDNVAKEIADRGTRFPLTTQASGKGISVYVDGVEVPFSIEDGYFYEASTNSIVFTGKHIPSKGQKIEVVYHQNSA